MMVATLSKPFYQAAIMAAESLKDEVPDAAVDGGGANELVSLIPPSRFGAESD